MNVLFVDQFSELGGAQRCLLDVVPAIRERGGQLFAAIPGHGALASHLQASGVRVFSIPCGPYRSGAKTPSDAVRFAADVARQTRILRRIAADHPIDLVYANGPRLWPAAARSSGGRIPVVCHAHNYIGRGLQARIAGAAIRQCDATVIACCQFVGMPLCGFARDRFRVVPNGTRDCGYRVRDFGARGWRIGIVGRIAPEKGQIVFVEAAARLAPLLPRSQFVICGAPMFADSRYFAAVQRAADGLPFEFTGWRDDIDSVLAGLDALVIASEQEALPRVMLEAFSAGVPVVAFDVGGIGEAIKDEATGFLTRGMSPAALSNRIRQAIADPEKLRRIAALARSVWERSYTIDHYRLGILRELDRAMSASRKVASR